MLLINRLTCSDAANEILEKYLLNYYKTNLSISTPGKRSTPFKDEIISILSPLRKAILSTKKQPETVSNF